MTIQFWISSSVSDISRRTSKSSEIGLNFACFSPPNFFGGAPPPKKNFDWHYKIRPSTDHRAKFHAGRPTHLGDLALNKKTSCVKHKSFRKLSFSGGLKKKQGKVNKNVIQIISSGGGVMCRSMPIANLIFLQIFLRITTTVKKIV